MFTPGLLNLAMETEPMLRRRVGSGNRENCQKKAKCDSLALAVYASAMA
jgi:hypothetical protein